MAEFLCEWALEYGWLEPRKDSLQMPGMQFKGELTWPEVTGTERLSLFGMR